MCTATWIRSAEGYELFFNRDELRTRAPALPPTVRELRGVRFVAPTDGDAGGTWLGVNDRGVTIGLANGVPAACDREPTRSRGLLVLDLLPCASLGEVREAIAAIDAGSYRAFELFALGPRGEGRLWRWDGREIAGRDAGSEGTLILSSSRDADRARIERERLLEKLRREHGGLDAGLLAAFHESHEPERGAWSPCMHREDAGTVSESRIRVGRAEVAFTYAAGPPCERARPATVAIPRRAPA